MSILHSKVAEKTDKESLANEDSAANDKPTITASVPSQVHTSTKQVDKPSETCKAPQKQPNKPGVERPKVPSELSRWRNVSWCCEELCGHDDLVLDCDVETQLDLAITCSRDTTVKVSIGSNRTTFLFDREL